MNKANPNEAKKDSGDRKKHININIGLLVGLFGGAILGIFIGAAVNDIPFYTGFGMLLGMAISFDITAHIKHKREQSKENDKMRT